MYDRRVQHVALGSVVAKHLTRGPQLVLKFDRGAARGADRSSVFVKTNDMYVLCVKC